MPTEATIALLTFFIGPICFIVALVIAAYMERNDL